MIFTKPPRGITYGADRLTRQVRTTANHVDDLASDGIFHQAVDGEIAALRIESRIAFKMNFIRAPRISIFAFTAKRGDFHLGIAFFDENDTKVCAHQNCTLESKRQSAAGELCDISKSLGSMPSNRSRTQPPTKYALCPRFRNWPIKARASFKLSDESATT